MRPNRVLLATASLLLLTTLTACASDGAATASPTPDASETPTPTPTPTSPLACDDLVPPDTVAATLVGADGEPVEPVAAVNGSDAFTGVLVDGVGGLACSWRVGDGMPAYNSPSDWAYLRVDVLPDAADEWVPLQLGDAPSTDSRGIAGIEASVAGGDPGWFISAPVGEDWVVASIRAAALTAEGGRFAGVGGDVMIDRLADVAEAAFATLADATPEQLQRPSVQLRESDAACTGALAEAGVVAAMQFPADMTVEYVTVDATSVDPRYFDDAVRAAARTFDCRLVVDGQPWISITAAPGFGPLFGAFRAPDGDVTFEEIDLGEVPAGVDADGLIWRTQDGPPRSIELSVDDTLIHIAGIDVASGLARAIVAQAG